MRPASATAARWTCLVLFLASIATTLLLWRATSLAPLTAKGQAAGGSIVALGRLTGALLQLAMMVQLLLIGRVPWIERAFGHERMNTVHRTLGYSLAALLLAHPALTIWGQSISNTSTLWNAYQHILFNFLKKNVDDYVNTSIAAGLFFAVMLSSIPPLRRKLGYDRWHLAHLATWIAIFMSLNHQTRTGDFEKAPALYFWLGLAYGVIGLTILFRAMRPLWLWWRHRFTVDRIQAEAPGIWSVYVRGQRLEDLRFQSGQYAELLFIRRGLWMPHPFSFSQAHDGKTLRFTIKAYGRYTQRIERLHSGTRLLIDGPLGVFTANRARREKILMIAGGIGITPLRALAEELAPQGRDLLLLYGAQNESAFIFRTELAALAGRYPNFHIHYAPSNEMGRIDAALLTKLAPDLSDRESFLCGPPAMIASLRIALRDLGTPDSQIHFERFSF